MTYNLLEVKDLVTQFKTNDGTFKVVNKVSFTINQGETVGLVGESGSGKSITSLSILGLIKPPGKITSGTINFLEEDLINKKRKEMYNIRGRDISMIFQEPMTSLNPVISIGEQIAETTRLHLGYNNKQAKEHAVEMLRKVGISMPEARVSQYPHELSGGMRQRVMIAIALSCNPKLLIADEPTTALDVTIQAQILELLKDLNKEFQMGLLLVTHDLGVVSEMCEKVIVMYAGQIVEQGLTKDILTNPEHPYTEALIKSIPKIKDKRGKLYSIPGAVPSHKDLPQGCRFHTRCPYAMEHCKQEEPKLKATSANHFVSCWLFDKDKEEKAKFFREEAIK